MNTLKKSSEQLTVSLWVLRIALCLVQALTIIGVSFLGIKMLPSEMSSPNNFEFGWLFIGILLSAIPFFLALVYSQKILILIQKNTFFSRKTIYFLQMISYCAFCITFIYLILTPSTYQLAQQTDAPGILLMTIIIGGAACMIGLAARVFRYLVERAYILKSENDLTV